MGATWGVTPVLIKVAVNAGHHPLGMIVWGNVISVVLSGIVTVARGRKLPISRAHLKLYVVVALLGAMIPHVLNFTAVAHLPAGIMSILIALVPMFSMPIALAMGFEKASVVRFVGALCGAVAIVLIVGPDAALPDAGKSGLCFGTWGLALLRCRREFYYLVRYARGRSGSGLVGGFHSGASHCATACSDDWSFDSD